MKRAVYGSHKDLSGFRTALLFHFVDIQNSFCPLIDFHMWHKTGLAKHEVRNVNSFILMLSLSPYEILKKKTSYAHKA